MKRSMVEGESDLSEDTSEKEFSSDEESIEVPTPPKKSKKTYICPYATCLKECPRKDHLIVHIRIYHTFEKPYKCDFQNCDQDFVSSSGLSSHKRSHAKEKPFVCQVCKHTFVHLANLVTHERTHTLEIGRAHV